jgi:hypothetical protein
MNDWLPIDTFDLPKYVDAVFIYRDEMIVGIGYKCGHDCDGLPMFKVTGGIEYPTHWMPLPELPAKEGKPSV